MKLHVENIIQKWHSHSGVNQYIWCIDLNSYIQMENGNNKKNKNIIVY